MIKIIKWFGLFLLLLILVASIFILYNLRDRNPGYSIDLNIQPGEPGLISAGFSALTITPEVPDQWFDVNKNAKFDSEEGDTYSDKNGNGRFDAVWMAGFDQKRAANGIHDDLWARTMVLDDGYNRFSLTVIDAIGIFHDEVIEIRKAINPEAGITYSVIASTHTHEAPDLMGLWGTSFLKSGIDPAYLTYVRQRIVASIETAARNLQPARILFSQDQHASGKLVTDTRKPMVMDHGIRIMHVLNKENNESLGTLLGWANHPETVWSDNLLITSDFPHFIREGIENGIVLNDSLIMEGVGGISIFLNGAIGGLMTTPPELPIKDPWTESVYQAPDFNKARSLGYQVAEIGLKLLQQAQDTLHEGSIGIAAKTFDLPLDNPLFRIGAASGILDRGYSKWGHMRTEIAYITLGQASILTYPGEVYPELINGGIEAPAGQDFLIDPMEIPVARDLMKGNYKFIIGLGNDELGYIIPKSEWDETPPYLYHEKESPYGEINSLGPDTSPLIHRQIEQIIEDYYN